jgi:GTPase SAR1 family protein
VFKFILSRDTAGQRHFRTIGKSHYASTKAFVLVYDVTNPETFRLIEQFNQLIEQVREKFYFEIYSIFLIFRLDWIWNVVI